MKFGWTVSAYLLRSKPAESLDPFVGADAFSVSLTKKSFNSSLVASSVWDPACPLASLSSGSVPLVAIGAIVDE